MGNDHEFKIYECDGHIIAENITGFNFDMMVIGNRNVDYDDQKYSRSNSVLTKRDEDKNEEKY